MTEKCNGIRVFWDGHTLIRSNQHKSITLPQSVLSQLPTIPFEAQLWNVLYLV